MQHFDGFWAPYDKVFLTTMDLSGFKDLGPEMPKIHGLDKHPKIRLECESEISDLNLPFLRTKQIFVYIR